MGIAPNAPAHPAVGNARPSGRPPQGPFASRSERPILARPAGPREFGAHTTTWREPATELSSQSAQPTGLALFS